MSNADKAVLEAVRRFGRVTAEQVSDRIDLPAVEIQQALNRLVLGGAVLEHEGDGWPEYTVAPRLTQGSIFD